MEIFIRYSNDQRVQMLFTYALSIRYFIFSRYPHQMQDEEERSYDLRNSFILLYQTLFL